MESEIWIFSQTFFSTLHFQDNQDMASKFLKKYQE